ncbi:MAG: c-type cytochrome [Burkholderiales bacterium]
MILIFWRWSRAPLLWLALWQAAVGFAQSPPLEGRLKLLLVQCGACHGEDGNSRIENFPSLAGQPEFFLMNQLFLMREGVRRIEPMAPLVKALKDDELQALAAFYSKLPAKPSGEAVDAALAMRGAALATSRRCASCHLPSLAGQEQMPRLARQRIDYLVYSMKAFRDDKRSGADTLMSATVIGLSDADLAALAHYAASR